MDNDSIDDVALGTTLGALGIIRGTDGNYANLEYLVDIQLSPGAHQILGYDANFDGKDDVFVRILGNLYLILSDTTAPAITQLPIDPVHPTVLDDFVTIEVDVNETSDIELSLIHI